MRRGRRARSVARSRRQRLGRIGAHDRGGRKLGHIGEQHIGEQHIDEHFIDQHFIDEQLVDGRSKTR
jgi:hypothetical protein